MQDLTETHQEMLDLVAAHERQTSQAHPDTRELTRLRLEMMKMHRRRLAQLEALALMSEGLPARFREHIEQFRQEDIEMTAFASRHVGDWPIDRIVREWDAYKEVAAHNHSWQRDRIAREVSVFSSLK